MGNRPHILELRLDRRQPIDENIRTPASELSRVLNPPSRRAGRIPFDVDRKAAAGEDILPMKRPHAIRAVGERGRNTDVCGQHGRSGADGGELVVDFGRRDVQHAVRDEGKRAAGRPAGRETQEAMQLALDLVHGPLRRYHAVRLARVLADGGFAVVGHLFYLGWFCVMKNGAGVNLILLDSSGEDVFRVC